MTKIYQLDGSTLYLCNSCLDDLGPIPGTWKETPLETCSVCGEIDLQSREEIDRYHYESDQRMWEDHIGCESAIDERYMDWPNS